MYAFALWPAILGASLGVLVAFLLSLLFPGLPPAFWISLALLGATVGLVWQFAVLSAKEVAGGQQSQRISSPVAFLGFAFVGGLWGHLVASFAGASVALLCVAAAPWVFGKLFCSIAKRRFRVRAAAFATIAFVVGFAAPYVISLAFNTPGT